MGVQQTIQILLTNSIYLLTWGIIVAFSLAVLMWDIRQYNSELQSLMKFVWGFTVLYSGPIGLAGYWWSGRTQIDYDSFWRKGFRSVCHCYSGCGTGEDLGVSIAVDLLAFKTTGTILLSFTFAYLLWLF